MEPNHIKAINKTTTTFFWVVVTLPKSPFSILSAKTKHTPAVFSLYIVSFREIWRTLGGHHSHWVTAKYKKMFMDSLTVRQADGRTKMLTLKTDQLDTFKFRHSHSYFNLFLCTDVSVLYQQYFKTSMRKKHIISNWWKWHLVTETYFLFK